MATQTVEFTAPPGLSATLKARIYNPTTYAVLHNDLAATEVIPSVYQVSFTNTLQGIYRVTWYTTGNSDMPLNSALIALQDSTAIFRIDDPSSLLLIKNVADIEKAAGEHTLCTVILASLEYAISGTTWTIKRTDGSTTHYTKTLTVDAGADPVTAVT